MSEGIGFNPHMLTSGGIISLLLLMAAFVMTLMSAYRSLKIKRRSSYHPSMKGLFHIPVVVLLSYSVIVFMLLRESTFPPDLLTSSLVILGAVLFHVIVKVTKTFLRTLQHSIDKCKRLESRLKDLSLIDELTGLYNYRGFLNLIEHHLILAKRNKHGVLVFYADLENMVNIQETLGHEEARMMIVETANLLKKSFRNSDIAARVTESEFMVFLIETTKEHADEVARNFQTRLDMYNEGRNKKYKLPVKFCMTPYDPEFNRIFDNIHAQAEDFMSALKKAKQMAGVPA